MRLDRQCPVEARQGFVEAFLILENGAAIVQRLGQVGFDGQRPVIARQRLVMALEMLQDYAAVVQRPYEIRGSIVSARSKLASASV